MHHIFFTRNTLPKTIFLLIFTKQIQVDLECAGKPQKYFFKHFEDPAAKKYFEDSASTLVSYILIAFLKL